MVFTGNANPALASDVARHLNIPLGRATVGRFSDGEVMVELLENVRGRDIFILQSACTPTTESLMEILLMADAQLAVGELFGDIRHLAHLLGGRVARRRAVGGSRSGQTHTCR